MSKVLSILLGSLFIIIPVGTLVNLLIYGPAREGPLSLADLTLVSILFVVIGAFIAVAIVVPHWKETEE